MTTRRLSPDALHALAHAKRRDIEFDNTNGRAYLTVGRDEFWAQLEEVPSRG